MQKVLMTCFIIASVFMLSLCSTTPPAKTLSKDELIIEKTIDAKIPPGKLYELTTMWMINALKGQSSYTKEKQSKDSAFRIMFGNSLYDNVNEREKTGIEYESKESRTILGAGVLSVLYGVAPIDTYYTLKTIIDGSIVKFTFNGMHFSKKHAFSFDTDRQLNLFLSEIDLLLEDYMQVIKREE